MTNLHMMVFLHGNDLSVMMIPLESDDNSLRRSEVSIMLIEVVRHVRSLYDILV